MQFTLMFYLFSIVIGNVSYADILYIDPVAEVEVSGSTQVFNSIKKALGSAGPGDTVHLRPGDYFEDIKTVRSGSKDSPIIIFGSRDAILHGKRGARVVEINHDYVELQGFTINGAQASNRYAKKLIYVVSQQQGKGVTGLRITDMALYNAADECLRLRYLVTNAEVAHNTIRNCGIEDFQRQGQGKNGEAIYIGTAPEQTNNGFSPDGRPDTSHNNWVHHNVIAVFGSECIDIKESSHHNLIEHNICTDQVDLNSGGISVRGHHNTLRYNRISDCAGVGIRVGGDASNDALNNRIEGNRIERCERGGIKIQSWPQQAICGNRFKQLGNGKSRTGKARKLFDPEEECTSSLKEELPLGSSASRL